MELRRKARPTLTPVEMDRGDVLRFELLDGTIRTVELLEADARILFTTLDAGVLPLKEVRGGRTFYEFSCRIRVDGAEHVLRREVPTQRTFDEPWVIAGMTIFFDGAADIFTFLREAHGECRPKKHARFAIQDATARICPPPLHAWCPLPKRGMDIFRAFLGEDCWMGPYFGASAHGGLDINHPAGTPIRAPLDFDDQYFFNTVAGGANNNRHRGHHRWPDGSEWQLQCHHMTRLTVAEHSPVAAGEQYADGAGVLSGYHDHSHFVFRVVESDGDAIMLDPWILFRQMYLDIAAGLVPDRRET
ncbi:MAG: hypothetical protein BIFFINMI_01413 [Phycisphaerae bacterium]|nr:hypothetical protein [Phycisphaerae bacterium]